MESKSHQIFRQRIEYANSYLQTVYGTLDFSAKFLKKEKNRKILICEKLGNSYDSLQQPLTECNRIFNFTKSNICRYYIVELYMAFDEYLQNVLKESFHHNSKQILGLSDKMLSITCKEILELGSYQEICEKVISDYYRELENLQSTTKLLDKIIKVYKITISDENMKKALAVLELRHLIIHNKTIIDVNYEKKYSFMNLKSKSKIPTKYDFVSKLSTHLTNLIDEFDKKLIEKNLLEKVEK